MPRTMWNNSFIRHLDTPTDHGQYGSLELYGEQKLLGQEMERFISEDE